MSEHPQHRATVAGRTTTGAARRAGRFNMRPVNLLLLIPLIGTLPPMFYNRESPRIGGMPFFYWYQLLWIAVTVILTYIVYRTTRDER